MLVLDTHDATSPSLSQVGVVVVLRHESRLEVREVGEVLLVHVSESDTGGGLHVAELTEGGLALDEAEGDVLASAESGQEAQDLHGLAVGGHDDELGLAFLDDVGDVVQAELDVVWLGADVGGLSVLRLGLGFRLGYPPTLDAIAPILGAVNAQWRQQHEQGH